MKIDWANLSERDRLVLGIGGVICFIYFAYLLIFSPLTKAVSFQSRQWVEKQETLIWMREQAKTKHASKKTSGNLLTLFSNELKHTSFSAFPYQLQQAGAGNVQLTFEKVPYVEFLQWLRRINQQYTMAIIELSIVRTQTPGMVKLRVVVSNEMRNKK